MLFNDNLSTTVKKKKKKKNVDEDEDVMKKIEDEKMGREGNFRTYPVLEIKKKL